MVVCDEVECPYWHLKPTQLNCKAFNIFELNSGSCQKHWEQRAKAAAAIEEESTLDEAQELIAQECDKVKKLLLSKNRKYGNSVLDPERIFSKSNTIEQINVRLDDKLSRIKTQEEDDKEDSEFDIIGYLIIKRVKRILMEKE